LGHKPDEFGLVTDQDGFIKIKEFVKAVSEEKGWKHIRIKHLNEILFTLPDPPIEIDSNLIRAKCRDKLPKLTPAINLPKLLYVCVRKKAYPFVLNKGIFPTGFSQVIMSSNQAMAKRMGRRIDQMPVLLKVNVQKSINSKVVFYQAGEILYSAEYIPTGCFAGPPPPKDIKSPKPQKTKEKEKEPQLSGSYLMNLDFLEDKNKQTRRKNKKAKIARDKKIKSARKQKQKTWPG